MSKKKCKKDKKDKKRRKDRDEQRPRGSGGKETRPESGAPCPGGKDCEAPGKHLCRIAKAGDLETLRTLARGAAFICSRCGRAARSAANLCRPVRL